MISEVHLLYSDTSTPPISTDPEYLTIENCESDDDDGGIEVVGEETVLLDKSVFPERYGHYKTLEIYLNPDQVETHAAYLKEFLSAPYVWVYVPGGNYRDGTDPLESTFDSGEKKIKFQWLLENPLRVRSVGVY